MYALIGLIIIIVIVILYFFAYPAIFLIKSNDISGYWMDFIGGVYYITSNGFSSFTVRHKNINRGGKITGTIFNNNIYINNSSNYGKYNIKTNTITFNDGTEWYKTPT